MILCYEAIYKCHTFFGCKILSVQNSLQRGIGCDLFTNHQENEALILITHLCIFLFMNFLTQLVFAYDVSKESDGRSKIYGFVSSFHYPPTFHRGAITLLSDSTLVLHTPSTFLQYRYSCTFDRFSVASTNFMYVIMFTFQKEISNLCQLHYFLY